MIGFFTWPVIKGATILSSTLLFATFVSEKVADGVGIAIGRDSSISLEAACIVGGVVLTFWINRKFDNIGKAANSAQVTAKTAAEAARDAHNSSLAMTKSLEGIKLRLDTLPCHKFVCKKKKVKL